MASGGSPRTASTARTAAYAVVAVVSFFLLLEGVLWLSGVTSLREERDPSFGFSDSARVYERDASRGVWKTPARAVKHSFNYQEFALEKPPNGLRVFTIGGSSAWGFPWGARVAFPYALGQALQKALPERAVESINAAAMSYGSTRLKRLATEVLDHEADILIVFEGHNEFVERSLQRKVAESPPPALGFAPLMRWRLYAALTRAWETMRREDIRGNAAEGRSVGELLGLDVVRETARYVDDSEKREAIRLFRDNYGAIVAATTRSGVRVVLCTVPANLAGWAPNQSVFDASVPAQTRREIEIATRAATARLDAGEPGEAVAILGPLVAKAPAYAETHFRIAQAYAALGRLDEARVSFARARDLDAMPTRVLGAINDAIRSFQGTPGVTVVDVEQLFEREAVGGLIGFDLIEDYVHPNPSGHRLIARALWKAILEEGLVGARRTAEVAMFDAAVGPLPESAPDDEAPAPLLYNLGIVLENRGLADEAMARFRACLAKDPTYVAAAYNLGRLLHRRGRFEEAVAAHRQALAADPGYVLSLVGLGEALRALGRSAEARPILERATREDPDSAYAWNGLGATLAAEGRPAEAEAAFRRAIAAQPDRTDTRANLGWALLAQGRREEAESVFRESLRMRPDHAGTRNGLAATLLEKGIYDEAARLFEETLALDPEDRMARAGLAEIAKRRGH